MTTICYGWQVRKLPYMEILPITCGHTVPGTLCCSWSGITPTTIIHKYSYRGVTSPSFSLRQVFVTIFVPAKPAIGGGCGRGMCPLPPKAEALANL